MFEGQQFCFKQDKYTKKCSMYVFYDKGKVEVIEVDRIPDQFVPGRHYMISDIYGYEVEPMREEDKQYVGNQSR